MKKAFTLIELSIVLIIIGLLVGGVLAGQELIKQAQLRAVLDEYSRYQTAVLTFQGKYGELPGDIDTASQFWPTDCVDDLANDNTCDGNNDNQIVLTSSLDINERLRVWQHLSLSGIIPGNYTGVEDANVADDGHRTTAGVNVPASQYTGVQIAIFTTAFNTQCGSGNQWATADTAAAKTRFFWGGAGGWGWRPLFTPEDMVSLDLKGDDGMPGTGFIRSLCADECVTNGQDEEAVYDLSLQTTECLATMSAI